MLLRSFYGNCEKKTNSTGCRFTKETKWFSTYIFLLSGPLAYRTLKANLMFCIPSTKSIYKYIRQNIRSVGIEEGVLRSSQLFDYLSENGLPLVVSLSEDQTRITNRVQFDSKTNQLLGFVLPYDNNGMPKPRTFLARSAKEIEEHFLINSHNVSSYVNVVMAQPLAEGFPAFALMIFGSNSQYTAKDVSRRWNHIKCELMKFGIQVLAICSDSEPKYNSAMRNLAQLGAHNPLLPNVHWFQSSMLNDTSFVQDTEHIGTKFRNHLLKTNGKLTIGQYSVSLSHLEWLIQNVPKDKHSLTQTTINPLDKQNFASVLKISEEKVTKLLSEKIPESLATVLYLEIMRESIDSFRKHNLKPLERIYKIWHACFTLRFWRNSIKNDKEKALKTHFVSLNTYSCVELNAHSIVLIVCYLKSQNLPNLFLPLLLGSQPCEGIFRQIRSLTTSQSTVTNFTLLEFMNKICRVELQSFIAYKALPEMNFPQVKIPSPAQNEHQEVELPEIDQILAVIETARDDAMRDLAILKMQRSAFADEECDLHSEPIELPYEPEPERDQFISHDHDIDNHTDRLSTVSDLDLRDYSIEKNINLRCLPNNAPYVKIDLNSGKTIVVKKISLCWLFMKDKYKLSSDRLSRVKSKVTGSI